MNKLRCLFFFFFVFSTTVVAQDLDTLVKKSKEFQKELNEEFASKETSPLPKEDIPTFKEHDFYKINPELIVVADFVRTPYEPPFTMATTTDRKPIYRKYGEAYFYLEGKEYKLNIYQSQRLMTDPQYKDYLFVPFTDLTNGNETYGGGRYLDLSIPRGNKVILDFNQAYNPYCAYNGRYSCPIPPKENNLNIKIEAGVKKYKEKKGVK